MWAFLLILAKLGVYASLIGCIGAAFCLWFIGSANNALFARIGKYGIVCGLWALLLCLLGFLIQVGMTSQAGILGAFDGPIFEFLWKAQVGDALRYRLFGSVLAIGGFLLFLRNSSAVTFFVGVICLVAALVLICSSFFTTGHTQGLGWLAKLAITLHLLCLGCWIGALIPLYWSAAELPADSLARLLVKFGDLALWLLIMLTLAGGYLIVELLGSPLQLFASTYGGAILLKLSLVGILMLLAARNRYSLVPQILATREVSISAEEETDQNDDNEAQNAIDQFRVTLVFEFVFAMMILLVTAAITSLTGPSH